ncbi:MAG: DNA gyrase inhibitor YacG [Acidobacteriia bacterium]|nr:DNA gyrase inhibitor YacG [Terriglobia bacterium]
MPRKPIRSLRCPTCRALVLAGDENFPFCSDRCRLIDLGKWASGGYVISTPITDPEQLENMLSEESKTARTESGQESRYRDTETQRSQAATKNLTTDPARRD